MVTIDQMAYDSRLRQNAPAFKGALAMITLILCIFVSTNGFSLLTLIIMTIGCVGVSGVSPKRFFKLCTVPVAFVAIGVLTIAVRVYSEPAGLLSLPLFNIYICFTEAGLAQALNIFLKSIASVTCLYFLCLTTPMNDILGMLYRCRIPKIFVEIMMLTYRFIFVMLNTADNMAVSQKSRLSNVSYRSSFKSVGILGAGVFIRSFKKSGDILYAMESRGYDGTVAYLEEKKTMTGVERGVLAVYVLGIAAAAAGFIYTGI